MVDAFALELGCLFDIASQVSLLARRGEGAGDGDQDDSLGGEFWRRLTSKLEVRYGV